MQTGGGVGRDFFQVLLNIPKRSTAIKNTNVHLLHLPAHSPVFSPMCSPLGGCVPPAGQAPGPVS